MGVRGARAATWRLLSPGQVLRRRALRGALGGHRRWVIIGGLLWGGSKARRVFGRQTESLTLPKLRPGQSVGLTVMRPPTRRERRAARRGG